MKITLLTTGVFKYIAISADGDNQNKLWRDKIISFGYICGIW